MKIGRSYSFKTNIATFDVDLSRPLYVSGNLAVPINFGELYMHFYPYEDYYVKVGRKTYHIDSKDKWDILVNKITVLFNLAKM